MRLFRYGLGVVAILLATTPLIAHDVWLVPSSFRPAVDELVSVRLFVGHGGDEEPLPRRPHRIDRFVAVTSTGDVDVMGRPGSDPAGYLRLAEPGAATVVYRNHATITELGPAKFEAYAREEGLDNVLAYRAAHGEEERPGRERYRRFLKSLLWVGETGEWSDRSVGLDLELVVDELSHDELSLRLYAQGEPVTDALIDLWPLGQNVARAVRTDASGRARFSIGSGAWVASAIVARRAVDDPEVDWSTAFTTLSFGVDP
ncbi:MAG: DUF4198 domain-containing protein [Acidobacteriota bacterium]